MRSGLDGIAILVDEHMPRGQVTMTVVDWQPVRCPHCGKRQPVDATPGSTVRIVCPKCKATSAVAIAA